VKTSGNPFPRRKAPCKAGVVEARSRVARIVTAASIILLSVAISPCAFAQRTSILSRPRFQPGLFEARRKALRAPISTLGVSRYSMKVDLHQPGKSGLWPTAGAGEGPPRGRATDWSNHPPRLLQNILGFSIHPSGRPGQHIDWSVPGAKFSTGISAGFRPSKTSAARLPVACPTSK